MKNEDETQAHSGTSSGQKTGADVRDTGQDRQFNKQSEPSLPEPGTEEKIQLRLLEVVKSEPTEMTLDLRLKELSKQFNVGIRPLRKAYAEVEASWRKAQAEASHREPTEEELAAQAEVRQEELKRQEVERGWQEKVAQRAEQIALLDDIPSELQNALRKCFGYIAGAQTASTLAITHASRLLPRSTGFVLRGASASGKSDLIEFGSEFLPPECVVLCTSYSNQALSYMGDLKHKYVVGGELKPLKPGEDDSAQQTFRQLISGNRISRHVAEQGSDGKTVANVYETVGPVTFVQTTTHEPTYFNDEYINRLSWCSTDDSEELTEDVLNLQAKVASSVPDEQEERQIELEINAWRHFHRNLQSLKVVVPYATKIIPKSRDVTVRRLFQLLLNYIRASALLHQATRERISHDGKQPVLANLKDYKTAYDLVTANAPRVLDLVSDKGRGIYNTLREEFKTNEFTRAQAQLKLQMSLPTVKRYLRELTEAGCLDLVGKDGKAYLYRIVAEPAEAQDLGLIHPNKLE